ncbi:MAG: hypothetical protein HJJLKODD_00122 [Phycisphaerae bacterium]|nr:hypothetical protein [Phycisphaerae bacterium]
MSMNKRMAGGWRRLTALSSVLLVSMCSVDPENSREFRDSAAPQVQSGLLSILTGEGDIAGGVDSIITGIVDGLFQVITPDDKSTS